MIRVSSNPLPMLGARASHGALFEAADDEAGRAPKAVLGPDGPDGSRHIGQPAEVFEPASV